MIRCSTILLISLFSSATYGNDFVCQSGNITRLITVEYEHKGWQVPCRVKYEKVDEGGVTYPWNAQASPGYCEDRAKFLVSKLKNWGWVCSEIEDSKNDEPGL